MQRVKKLASAKIITAWISFCQLKSCSRIRATFTKITHTFEKESKKKKWPQFLCNREFYTKQKFSKSISNYFFFSLKSNIWRLFQESFKNIFDLIFSLNFFFSFFFTIFTIYVFFEKLDFPNFFLDFFTFDVFFHNEFWKTEFFRFLKFVF